MLLLSYMKEKAILVSNYENIEDQILLFVQEKQDSK